MKILVNVQVPAIDNQYDMLIPDFLTVKDVIPLVTQAIEEMTGSIYKSSGKEVLCFGEMGVILGSDYTLHDGGVKNGDTLVLV